MMYVSVNDLMTGGVRLVSQGESMGANAQAKIPLSHIRLKAVAEACETRFRIHRHTILHALSRKA